MDLQARACDQDAVCTADRMDRRRHPLRPARGGSADEGQALAPGEERGRLRRDGSAPRARSAPVVAGSDGAHASGPHVAGRAVIDRDRLVDLALRLVSTPSFTGSEEEAARVMLDEFHSMGLRTQWQEVEDGRANVFGVWAG